MPIRALLALLVILTSFAGLASAAPLGTTFTYQGQLQDQGAPATGSYDFLFRLFDAASNGNQIGSSVVVGDVTVTDGVFTAPIDFGASAFNGEARYLDVAVRPGASTGSYTPLTPRQPLTATPYALQSLASGSVPWSGVTGVPAGLADGVDNDTTYTAGTGLVLSGGQFGIDASVTQVRVSGTCPAGQSIRAIAGNGSVTCEVDDNSGGTITGVNAGTGLSGGGTSGSVSLNLNFAGSGSADTVARSDHDHGNTYQARAKRTVIVSPAASTGASGTALLVALAAITDASSSNPYVLKIEPGIYDLGTSHLIMKDYVDVEGSGEQVTTVQGTGGASANTGTIVGASNAEVRGVTVKSSGGAAAVAIYTDGATLRLNNVTAIASGASSQNFAIVYKNASVAEVTNSSADASGGADARAFYALSSLPFLSLFRATASAATTTTGVYNDSSNSVMTNVDAAATGGSDARAIFNAGSSLPIISGGSATAANATRNYGLYNNAGGSTFSTTHVNVYVFGGSEAYGVYNNSSSSGSLSGLRILSFFAGQNYGIYNTAASGLYLVDVDNSVITASTGTIRNDAEFTTRIGASKLDGGDVSGGGNVICAGVHDESYAFTAGPTCP